jgi:hypothetical protein
LVSAILHHQSLFLFLFLFCWNSRHQEAYFRAACPSYAAGNHKALTADNHQVKSHILPPFQMRVGKTNFQEEAAVVDLAEPAHAQQSMADKEDDFLLARLCSHRMALPLKACR